MALLNLELDINDLLEDGEGKRSEHRTYLGYSGAGHPCARKLWYDLHWAGTQLISPRLQRIFDTGHNAEDFMIKQLESKGIEVFGEQEEVVGHAEHILGHIDGMCTGVPGLAGEAVLLEMKTMNDKAFKDVVKNKVKKSKPGYYAQMMCYMGKLGISHGLFMSYNKNDSSYYYEIIDFDKAHYEYLESRLFDTLTASIIPERLGGKTWFECRFCSYKDICHNNVKPDENCRTCAQGTIEDRGAWTCDGKKKLDKEAQQKGCASWTILEELL